MLFCLTMEPVYRRLAAALRPRVALYPYSDDAYLLADSDHLIATRSTTPALYTILAYDRG
jgi:hypothetical protein